MAAEVRITLDAFERWAWRIAMLCLLSPVIYVPMAVLFEDRIFLAIHGTVAFFIGLILKIGLGRLRTNPTSAVWLIERSFYLAVADAVPVFLYMCWTNQIFFTSVLGIAFFMLNFLGMVLSFLYMKEKIQDVKALVQEADIP